MATIDLNNLIRPKNVNSSITNVAKQATISNPVYVDLHFDIELAKSVGLGNNSANSKDIVVDTNVEAIKNSIRNIFNTRPGEKVLNPEFGCSLEKYLFDAVSNLGAQAIGDDISTALATFEPRVTLIKLYVETQPYSTQSVNLVGNQLTTYVQNQNPNVALNIGPGYSITLIYKINEFNQQNDYLNIFAQIGGQILI
jgi:phage baseplate assembly protein W